MKNCIFFANEIESFLGFGINELMPKNLKVLGGGFMHNILCQTCKQA